MPETDLQLLDRAAREAGQIALRYWRNEPRFWDKGGDDGPVSEADLAVNDHLAGLLRAARPDYGWLSEESPDDVARLGPDGRGSGALFILDPIDGTRAFLDGQQGFSHSLAVVRDGRVTAAAVHLPALDLTYLAEADGPATLNGHPIRAQDHALDGATVLASKISFAPASWRDGVLPPIKREFRPSLAWRLCLVAEGRFNAALSLRGTWEWDVAAGCLIAERAGCRISDCHGRQVGFNAASPKLKGLVVAAPGLHHDLLARLAPAP